VMYEEFEGGHTIPPAVAQRSIDWFLGPVCSAPP
jgi:predicted esterase